MASRFNYDFSHEEFPFESPLKLETKNGVVVDFRFFTKYEENISNLFRRDIVLSFVDGVEVGYHKVTYVDSSSFSSAYPDILHFLICGRGSATLPEDHMTKFFVAKEYSKNKNKDFNFLSSDDKGFDLFYKSLISEAKKKNSHQLKSFKAYHVDRPYTEYSRVYSKSDQSLGTQTCMTNEPVGDYIHQGIGKLMYIATGLWMQSRGLNLNSSGLLSSDSGLVWNSFFQSGITDVVEIYKGEDQDPYLRYKLDIPPEYVDKFKVRGPLVPGF